MSLELNQKSELAFGPVHFFFGAKSKRSGDGSVNGWK